MANPEEVRRAEVPTPSPARRSWLSWASIFGGTFAALGTWILLGAFGLAAGFGSMEPADQSLREEWIWLGIWSLIIPILAGFVGAFVASRAASAATRRSGLMHGFVTWGFTTAVVAVLGVWLTGSAVGRTLTATTQLAGTGAVAASAAGSNARNMGQGLANFLDIDRSMIMQQLNQQLGERGEEPITAAQLRAALRDAGREALREGDLTEQMLIGAFAEHTPLTPEEVRQVAGDISQQWNQTVDSVRDATLSAVNTLGNGMWWIFFSMLIALGASLGGGILGTIGRRGEMVREESLSRRKPSRPHEQASVPT